VTILVDTDVLLDVALGREPFAEPACRLLDHLQANPGKGIVAWHSVANFYYLVRPSQGDVDVRAFIAGLLGFLNVVAGDTASARAALALPIADFEDALQVAAAQTGDADLIVTRNAADYRRSPIPAKSPAAVVAGLVLFT
jgi:predicted nucleic acid-binding protein